MAFSLNRAQIIGNVTRDPEVRVAGGQKVATLGVATNFMWTDQTGQRKEKVEFHNVVVWRKLAEICQQYVRKGSKIYVEGRMQTRDWEGEDGVKRYKTEIIADNIIMLDRKDPSAVRSLTDEGATIAREPRALKQQDSAAAVTEEVSIDDLPF